MVTATGCMATISRGGPASNRACSIGRPIRHPMGHPIGHPFGCLIRRPIYTYIYIYIHTYGSLGMLVLRVPWSRLWGTSLSLLIIRSAFNRHILFLLTRSRIQHKYNKIQNQYIAHGGEGSNCPAVRDLYSFCIRPIYFVLFSYWFGNGFVLILYYFHLHIMSLYFFDDTNIKRPRTPCPNIYIYIYIYVYIYIYIYIYTYIDEYNGLDLWGLNGLGL